MLTRLDRLIRRLLTQRACLDWAVSAVAELPGPVLEFGLGVGRSYDHLRTRMPDRDIFVFDRVLVVHPECLPPNDQLIMGDFEATGPAAARRFPATAALVHADIGGHDGAASRALATSLVDCWAAALCSNGVLLCDQPFGHPDLEPLPLPAEAPGHYHLGRRHGRA